MAKNVLLPEGTTWRQLDDAFQRLAETANKTDVAREAEHRRLALEETGLTVTPDDAIATEELAAFRRIYLDLLEQEGTI